MIGFRLPEEVIELLEQEAKRHGLASVHEVARTILINTLMGVERQPNKLEKQVILSHVRTLALLQRLVTSLPDELLKKEADNQNGRGAQILAEGCSDAEKIMRLMGVAD